MQEEAGNYKRDHKKLWAMYFMGLNLFLRQKCFLSFSQLLHLSTLSLKKFFFFQNATHVCIHGTIAPPKRNHHSFNHKSKQFYSCSQECDEFGKQRSESEEKQCKSQAAEGRTCCIGENRG